MIKSELINQDKAHVRRLLLIWVHWFVLRFGFSLIHLGHFLHESQLRRDHSVKRDLSEWYLAARQDMHHVELEWL